MDAPILDARPLDNSILRRRRRELLVGAGLLVLVALMPLVVQDTYARNLVIITVLFADIRGFSNYTHGQSAQRVLELLNRYFEA